MKKILFIILLVYFISCEPPQYQYQFYITNDLENDTIVIYNEQIEDTDEKVPSFIILPKKTILFADMLFENPLLSDNKPNDVFDDRVMMDFSYNTFYINDVKLEKNLWLRKYWNFSTSNKGNAQYNLVVNSDLLKGD
ncbi:hypothetical protein M2451_004170 [Dysgonomonas sp. PFB1-18]|uniref:hypothetical protein n=1 Tax=unclassified Dysgonomonas TaxID=2630389 RepID=UPI002476D690|nr:MULTISPECIES: hypothetical protein [unclassified Dysgonomonas]MDH6307234.1 hypothetical protein [Dysgonomonas sp. PF1-14]MDH6337152.1 hypothetical protein [Dysgonomonas sp. PF1-16]MDH6382817.1 hypothetical protein [Dysgonomonas sp. PFB1-18]MDH6400099.1 hypothetical protein [Dysgonomonas sp. PF1-23]